MQRSSWYSFVWAAALVACVVLLGPPALKAGGCYSGASYSYGYTSYPSYSYSYSYPATTYYASSYSPSYSYTPSYEVKEVVVPKAVRAYVSPDYFSSVSDYYKDRLLVDAIAGKNTDASKLKEELAELKAQIKGLSAPPTQVSQPYVVPVPYQYPQPQQPTYQPPTYQQPYSQQTYAQPPQSQAPQGQTPCDWRAQQAYQQGVQAAQQQYAYQGQQAQAQRAAYEQQRQVQYERSYNQQGQYQQPQAQQQSSNGYEHQGSPSQSTRGQQYPQGQQDQRGYQPPQGPQSQQTPYISPRNEAAPGGQSVPEAQARNHAPAPLPGDYGPVPDGLSQTVSESCLRCHGDNNESAGHGFDLRDLRSVPIEDRMESYALVASGEMPSRAQPLSRDKVRLFKEWYRAARKSQAMRQSSGRSVAAR